MEQKFKQLSDPLSLLCSDSGGRSDTLSEIATSRSYIPFACYTLSQSEKNYYVTELETLAVVWAIFSLIFVRSPGHGV